ncbi:SIMPL domain-containing protein [Patiriisocius marinistellae]|uniref:SIMPL domain-containing protein n=1 Tax=Patiriisocius marinistellae TaxID=2494560 RepID=A0A5J4FWW6_9FLAO|nr:SIMPL domain-containing protein [Patiriisocius marinistellae]GEQ87227.1 SIMPL domain-containing protein [Patiriisocius marinistellae]
MKLLTSVLLILTTTLVMGQQTQKPSIDVTGEGIVSIIPDQVTINARVENTGKDAKTVKQQNDAVVNEVFTMLKKMGIKEKNIQTDYIRLNKNYEYNSKTYNYAANQAISIKLTSLSDYESVMNGLLQSGINRIDGVNFISSKQKELEQEARKNAVINAKMKANDYAGVLQQSVGKAIQISEFQQSSSPKPMYRAMAMDGEMAGGQQTISPGEMEIKVSVNISFELL